MSKSLHDLNCRRWRCQHCGTEGFGGPTPPAHDRRDGRACRPSGQLTEAEIAAKVARKIKASWP